MGQVSEFPYFPGDTAVNLKWSVLPWSLSETSAAVHSFLAFTISHSAGFARCPKKDLAKGLGSRSAPRRE